MVIRLEEVVMKQGFIVQWVHDMTVASRIGTFEVFKAASHGHGQKQNLKIPLSVSILPARIAVCSAECRAQDARSLCTKCTQNNPNALLVCVKCKICEAF